jgi:hypothetical protein
MADAAILLELRLLTVLLLAGGELDLGALLLLLPGGAPKTHGIVVGNPPFINIVRRENYNEFI